MQREAEKENNDTKVKLAKLEIEKQNKEAEEAQKNRVLEEKKLADAEKQRLHDEKKLADVEKQRLNNKKIDHEQTLQTCRDKVVQEKIRSRQELEDAKAAWKKEVSRHKKCQGLIKSYT